MKDEPNCTCRDCAFVGPLKESVQHHQATGHALVYRGVVQDFTRLIQQAEEWRELLAWRERALAEGRAWSRERNRLNGHDA